MTKIQISGSYEMNIYDSHNMIHSQFSHFAKRSGGLDWTLY